jgi:hypothetical protein
MDNLHLALSFLKVRVNDGAPLGMLGPIRMLEITYWGTSSPEKLGHILKVTLLVSGRIIIANT